MTTKVFLALAVISLSACSPASSPDQPKRVVQTDPYPDLKPLRVCNSGRSLYRLPNGSLAIKHQVIHWPAEPTDPEVTYQELDASADVSSAC
jgi:hypothetical protein